MAGSPSIILRVLLFAAAFGSLLVLARPASAQDSPISAEVDYTQLSIDEVLALTPNPPKEGLGDSP